MKIEEIQERFRVDETEAKLIRARAKKYGITIKAAYDYRKALADQKASPQPTP